MLNAAAIQAGTAGVAAVIAYCAIHTALPDVSGSNQSTAARQPTGATSINGVITITNKAFTGGAASGPATYLGLWSALTAGVFYGYHQLTGDQTFNAAGQYTLTSETITGSAT